jgi:dTMP kinase
MHKSSFFFTFEGIEGSGKSTQLQKLQNKFESLGFQVHSFREPGATEIGEQIRNLILNQSKSLDPQTELLLFMAARNELIQTQLKPILEKPKQIVLIDRFYHSSLAYQGHARGMGFDKIEKLHNEEPFTLKPQLTFYLRIDLKTSLERQNKRGQNKDYFEKESNLFHQKLIEGYDLIWKKYPDTFLAISASGTEDEVHEAIWNKISKVI